MTLSCVIAVDKAQKKGNEEREHLEKQDTIAAEELAVRLEKERLRIANKAEMQQRDAAKKAWMGKGAGWHAKVMEDTKSESKKFSSVNSLDYMIDNTPK